ncbi:DUF1989 domain-containing protein [Methylobacterium nonmethylotrophicum]|uniref:Urea carboxylase-associated family protein n=1 Tax=Methylobacterium nonmethylotrophicum TaxID=1141884 RepID=A0A4Z0NMJ2_9HYPH|nr:urea carboxylase-associated family protein [Methylobacterium nonmethylotrophicum]TGD97788.1 urea carboxylase-associated family protein [Methylobacterium nonmethylotrophicum]
MTASEPILLPARHGRAVRVPAGHGLRVINLHGTQVVDCWAWNAHDLDEAMSMEASRVWSQRLNPVVGDTFVTNRRNPILTLVEDTSPGIHDTFMAACDRHRYERLGCTNYHRNCLDNMVEALAGIGLAIAAPSLASFNIFMNIAVDADGRSLVTGPTQGRPGDFITLQAEMDCVVALSACPQDIVPIHGHAANAPKDAAFQVLATGFPRLPPTAPWMPAASAP